MRWMSIVNCELRRQSKKKKENNVKKHIILLIVVGLIMHVEEISGHFVMN